jgi:hypothetical protein
MWSITADVPHGANEVVYRGQDDTGYVGEAAPHGLYVDRDPPNAPTISTPRLAQTYTDQDSLVVKGQAELYVTVLLFVNGEPYTTTQANANGWWEVEVDLNEGSQTIFARTCDAAGNASETDSRTVTVIRDTLPPQISGSISPDLTRPGQTVVLSASVTDAGIVEQVVGNIEDVGDYFLGVGTGSHQHTLTLPTDLGEGEKQVVFTAQDAAGHPGAFTTTLLVDDTPPTVQVTGISESSAWAYASGATVYYGSGAGSFGVSVQASDALAHLEMITFADTTDEGASYNHSGATSAVQSHDYDFDAADTFSGDAAVVVTDRAGNEGTATFTVVRDVGAPQVSVAAQVQGDYVEVTWNASDPGSGLGTCALQVSEDGGGWTTLSGDCTGTSTYTDVQAGRSYAFHLQATDQVSNAAEESASLLYNDNPQVSVAATPPRTTLT